MHREQNKSKIVAEALERRIRNREWDSGTRLPSTRLLASKFDCSTQVIVDALNTLEKKRLIERKKRSGIFVRENPLAVNIEVGFLFSDTARHKSNLFLNSMKRMADEPFLESGFNFTLRGFSLPPHAEASVFHDELQRFSDRMNLDVLLLLAPFLNAEDVKFCRTLKTPVVFIGNFSDETAAMQPHNQVSGDDFAYASAVFRKLASLTVSDEIMFLSGSREHYFYREFHDGFIHAAKDAGVHVDLRELPIHFSTFPIAQQLCILRELFSDVLAGKNTGMSCFSYLSPYLKPLFERTDLLTRLSFYYDSQRDEDYGIFFRQVYRMIRRIVEHPETLQLMQSSFVPDVRLLEGK